MKNDPVTRLVQCRIGHKTWLVLQDDTDDNRREDWFITASGLQAFIYDPRRTRITIEDIAHSLSHICRFNGHTRGHYSVAQHSVAVSYLVPSHLQLDGLLHDAAEAYLGDIISPLKRRLSEYRAIEEIWEKHIATLFGLQYPTAPEVRAADIALLLAERRDLLPSCSRFGAWPEDQEVGNKVRICHRIVPQSPELANSLFIQRYQELTQRSATR